MAMAEAAAAQQNLNKLGSAKALVGHAKGKWIGGAGKGIAQAQEALRKATTPAEREAAQRDLAKWQEDKEQGLQALKERQAAYEQLQRSEKTWRRAHEQARAALAKAKDHELKTATALLASLDSVLYSDALDAKLTAGAILTHATPRRLAAFAQDGPEKAALVATLLNNATLMRHVLVAGGASHGNYDRAMEILEAIQNASPMAAEGPLQRLALATALEHTKPIPQSKTKEEAESSPPTSVDPVKRYLHYENAFLDGALDPAFKHLDTWEYRHVVNCDAPDEILQWGRDMLRNYRPDHIHNRDYGWRYVSAFRTEVPYGSQNVKYDRPHLHNYQNIIMNGGVCGRRAFFGRFILRAFGIPTWGVTQRAHAAVGHWTPKGWVVNLGAGFGSSWWDKDEIPLSGTQFLTETQARAHKDDYLKVLRARWIGAILGEPAYNERRKVEDGFWSRLGQYQAEILASTAVTLGPLGQELAEANEREQKVQSAAVSAADQ